MRKNRISSSNFGRVCKRKDNILQEKLVSELVNGKDISHIPAVKYGIDNESNAASIYANYMQSLHILDCGVDSKKSFSFKKKILNLRNYFLKRETDFLNKKNDS
jgi:hypothetical protein